MLDSAKILARAWGGVSDRERIVEGVKVDVGAWKAPASRRMEASDETCDE